MSSALHYKRIHPQVQNTKIKHKNIKLCSISHKHCIFQASEKKKPNMNGGGFDSIHYHYYIITIASSAVPADDSTQP